MSLGLKKIYTALFSVTLLDLLGFGIIIPIVPLLLSGEIGGLIPASLIPHREVVFGMLIGIYPLMQFFSAPFLGALSDHYGRRGLLMICLASTAFGYLLFAIGVLTGNLWMLFVGRAIDGFTGGSIVIVRAVIADISTEQTAAKNFGIIGIAVGIGFIIGPFLGSLLSDSSVISWFSFATPFWTAMILSLASLFIVFLYLPETLTERVSRPVTLLTGPRNIAQAFRIRSTRVLFIGALLQLFGFAMYTQFFQIFLIGRFNPPQLFVGMTIAYIGALVVLAQGVLNPVAVKHLSSIKIVTWALAALAISIVGIAISDTLPMMFFFLGISALASGFIYPNITALVSGLADRQSQGEIMGIYQSVESFSQATGPLVAGYVALRGVGLPLFVAAGAVAVSWLVFALFFKQQPPRGIFHEV